jgi:hypothetical protein
MDRVQTWITSVASMRPAAGSKKGRSSVTRRRDNRAPSGPRVARSAAVHTNAESQVSKGFVPGDGLEEEDENCRYPNQGRDIAGKRPREMMEVREKTSHLLHPSY